MLQDRTPDTLAPIDTYDFLPPVNRWVRLGSCFIVFAITSAVIASFSVKYRTTVKAAAIIRPAGNSRLVQSSLSGTIVDIAVQNNTVVQKGALIAKLDTTSLEARATELLANLEQGQNKLAQIQAQLQLIDQQALAESTQAQYNVAASVADYQQIRRTTQEQSISAQSALQAAQARVNLAQREIESFASLVDSGAVARLQLAEKQTELANAEAELRRAQAELNPSLGSVQAAQARIAQAEVSNAVNLSRLQQSKQQLIRESIAVQDQLQATERELAQINVDFKNSEVRSPITGVLHELNLRNQGQVISTGETLATIIPSNDTFAIRAMVPANQINKVNIGFQSKMRVSACPFSEFGTLKGKVVAVSPDTVTQAASEGSQKEASAKKAFYSVTIDAQVSSLASSTRRTVCTLQPGQEGLVTIISREETIFNFLLRKAGL